MLSMITYSFSTLDHIDGISLMSFLEQLKLFNLGALHISMGSSVMLLDERSRTARLGSLKRNTGTSVSWFSCRWSRFSMGQGHTSLWVSMGVISGSDARTFLLALSTVRCGRWNSSSGSSTSLLLDKLMWLT